MGIRERLDGLIDHELDQGKSDLGGNQHRGLALVVVRGRHLDHVRAYYRQAAESVQDGQEFARGPAPWLCCPSCCSSRRKSVISEMGSWRPCDIIKHCRI